MQMEIFKVQSICKPNNTRWESKPEQISPYSTPAARMFVQAVAPRQQCIGEVST